MEIEPRYDGSPIVTLAGGERAGGTDVGVALVRQRRRLQAMLASLSDECWRTPSRCAGWTVQDVAAHLDGVNRFWHWSIGSGLAGAPTRVLSGFDPKATPAAMVDAARSAAPGPAETLAALVESSEALCDQVGALDGEQWATIAEAPAGHVPVSTVVHHALWDCWVHERDVALPLGLAAVEEPDEVMASLRFAAALGPAFALQSGTSSPATLVVETTDPNGCVVVEVTGDHVEVHDGPDPSALPATVVVRDTAANLVEALSARAPLTYPVPEEHRWLVASLAEVFEAS
jgi:uncharacterized protein (TIGR03083 family)